MQPLLKNDLVAQLVEHIPFKDGVLGSNPSWVTKFKAFQFILKGFFRYSRLSMGNLVRLSSQRNFFKQPICINFFGLAINRTTGQDAAFMWMLLPENKAIIINAVVPQSTNRIHITIITGCLYSSSFR